MGKLSFVVTGIVLATFVMGRVESLAAHRGFGGSLVWAQAWDDSSDDASSQSGDALAKQPPPDVSGSWSGLVEDHRYGEGDLSATIGQKGSKLSGTWSTDVDGGAGGRLKGTIKANGSLKLTLKIRGACHLSAHGMFENGDEITGVYHASGCGKPDHGTFDITD